MNGLGEVSVVSECTPVVDAEFDPHSDQSPAGIIIEAVATAAGEDPTDLPPLYESIDPDVIDALFAQYNGSAGENTFLNFRVDTWNVFVRADGRVRVLDATQRTDPEPIFDSNID